MAPGPYEPTESIAKATANRILNGVDQMDFTDQIKEIGRRPTTTISTIAIKSGDYVRIVLAVLKSSNWIHIRIDEMTPSMLDVGNNLEESVRLKNLHEELMRKLAAKQENIEELLAQADNLVTQQQKPEADVYEAMAESLGAAWKELNRQLQLRGILLDHAVEFFKWARKHSEHMDAIEQFVMNTQLTDNLETANKLMQHHQQMRKDLLDSAVETMGYGDIVIEKLREVGIFVNNPEKPRLAVEACLRIEDLMLRLNDRRNHVEQLWEQRRIQLDWCVQACQIYSDLRQIEAWVREQNDFLQRCDFGESESSVEFLSKDHEKLLNEAMTTQEHVNRLYPLAQQLQSVGYLESGQLYQRTADVKRQVEELLINLNTRGQLLSASLHFFRMAATALAKLNGLESEIQSTELPRHSEALIRRHMDLAAQIQECSVPAIQHGRAILQKVANDAGRGVARKVDELERRVRDLDALCSAHKAEQMAKSQKYQEFFKDYTALYQWLINIGESFLLAHRDMGTVLPAATDFLERHRQMSADVSARDGEVTRIRSRLQELASDAGDVEFENIRKKTNELSERWDSLKRCVENRVSLGSIYQPFHKVAAQLATDMDTLEAMIRTIREVGDVQSHTKYEDLWYSVVSSLQQLKQYGSRFLVDSKLVTNDPNLDIPRAQLCVETLMDHFAQRHNLLQGLWDSWRRQVAEDSENREKWQKFLSECRQTLHWISQLQRDTALTYTRFEDPPPVVSDRQQRILDEFIPTVRKVQSEVETQLKMADTLGSKLDTRGEKEKVIDELMKANQKFQQMLNAYQSLTTMTVTFFKNLTQLDDWLGKVEEQFHPSRLPQDSFKIDRLLQEHDAAKNTVSELIKFTQNEGHQIVDNSRRQEVTPEVRREVEKIPGLIDQRKLKWDKIWLEQHKNLEQHSSLARFEEELRLLVERIERLSQQLYTMNQSIGSSREAVMVTSTAFVEFMKEVDIIDHKVRTFISDAEVMLAGPYAGNQRVRQKTEDLRNMWASFHAHLEDYRTKLTLAKQFFDLYEEIEYWCTETIEYLVSIGKKAAVVQTSEEVNLLMGQLETYIKPRQPVQEGRMKRLDEYSQKLYGEHWEHRVTPARRRYKEVIDSLHTLNDQLFSLAESLREKEARAREPPMLAPKFIQPLKDGQVMEGNRFEFMCRVAGEPTPSVTWFKDGLPILNNPDYETSYENGICLLRIEETFTEDSSVFTCRAVNPAGSAETAARLTVKESPFLHMQPPDFTKKLENVNAYEGDRQIFECHVVGNPAPTVTWHKNDQLMDNMPGVAISKAAGVCRLVLEEIFIEDDARYTCRAVNPAGEAASSAKLTVLPKPGTEAPLIVTPLESVAVHAGEKVLLECVISGNPQPQITWRHNNRILKDNRDIRIAYDGFKASLLIAEAYPNNSGTYSVSAKNRPGEATSTCQVVVRARVAETSDSEAEPFRPRFVQELKNMTVLEGDPVRIDCTVVGYPEPEVIWFKESRPVKESPEYQLLFEGDKCLLHIRRSALTDAGVYKCIARNAIGESTSLCRLTVQPKGPPAQPARFITNIQPQTVIEGHRVIFEARVTGEPEPEVHWFHNGARIYPSPGIQITKDSLGVHRLIIENAGPQHAGTYTVAAFNVAGESKSTANLIVSPAPPQRMLVGDQFYQSKTEVTQVSTPPEFLKPLHNVSVNLGTSAKLECVVIGVPKPTVTWLFNGRPIPPGFCQFSNIADTYALIIPDVRPEHLGSYQCVAENVRGTADSTGDLYQQRIFSPEPIVSVVEYAPPPPPQLDITPPKFIKTLMSAVCFEDESITFEGVVTGKPAPEISWYKDGKELGPHDGVITYHNGVTTLTLHHLSLKDVAKITCSAKNAGGIATSSAQLLVRPRMIAPDFVERLISKEVMEGDSLRWSVRVTGDPTPKVTWYRHDQPIKSCQDVQVLDEGNGVHTLYVPKLEMADAGQFTCRAENEAGEARSTADLVVRPKGQAAGAYYHVTKVFQEKQEMGMEVESHQSGQFQTTTRAAFSSRSQELDGMPLKRALGPSQQAQQPPNFIKPLQDKRAPTGQRVVLECQVSGQPLPSVKWTKEGQNAGDFPEYSIEQDGDVHRLVIQKVSRQDSGRFTVQAYNSAGSKTTSAMVIVTSALQSPSPDTLANTKKTVMAELEYTVGQPRKTQSTFAQSKTQRVIEQRLSDFDDGTQGSRSTDLMFSGSETDMEISGYNENVPFSGSGSPAAIRQPLKAAIVPEGSDALFQALISGEPQPKITWYKNGSVLSSSSKHVLGHRQNEISLRIKTVGSEDVAQYSVVVQNQFGRSESQANLVISGTSGTRTPQPRPPSAGRPMSRAEEIDSGHGQAVRPPQFIRVPGDLSVYERQMARFDVKVVGRPNPSVAFYKGDIPISDDSKHKLMVNQEGIHSLLISLTDQSDSGNYTCVANNNVGEARCTFSLNVMVSQQTQGPQFLEKFQSSTLKEGETIILRCKASGTPPPTLSWLKDNQPLFPGQPYRIEFGAGESSLYIQNAKPEDAGWYQCVATSASGTANYRGRISVQSAQAKAPMRPLQLQKGLVPEEAESSEVVTLRHVERARPKHRDEEEEAAITAPKFHSQLKDLLQLKEGQSAHFETKLTPVNDPNLKVIWMFNGRPIDASSRFSWMFDFGFATLDIRPVYPEDSGTYSCYAVNQLGEDQISAQMNVSGRDKVSSDTQHPYSVSQIEYLESTRSQGFDEFEFDAVRSREPPNFTQPLKSQVVVEGKPVVFELKLTPANDSGLRVEWFHNGKALQTGTRFRHFDDFGTVALHISYTVKGDAGTYMCRAWNSMGKAESSAELGFQEENGVANGHVWYDEDEDVAGRGQFSKPEFVQTIGDVEVVEGKRCHFEARLEPKNDPALKVEWLKDGQPIKHASRIVTHFEFGYAYLTLTSTYPEDSGVYTLLATNRTGKTELSSKLVCQSKKSVQDQTHHQYALPQIQQLEGQTVHIGPMQQERPEEIVSVEVPKFVRAAKPQTDVKEGQNVHFDCRVRPANDPKMVVEWLLNGKPLRSGHRIRPVYDFGHISLDIHSAVEEDSGTYTCVVTNQLGKTESTVELHVTGRKSLILESQRPEGLEKIQQLEIPRGPVARDGPEQICTGPPKISARFGPTYQFAEHETLLLEADLEPVNDPTMKVEWFLNDRVLITASRVTTTFSMGFVALRITSLIAEDSGLYCVRVTNAMGEASATCTVGVEADQRVKVDSHHVDSLQKIEEIESQDRFAKKEIKDKKPESPPAFVMALPESLEHLQEGENVHLECQVSPTNDSTMQIVWLRNEQPLPAGHRFRTFYDFGFISLDILGVVPEDFGIYKVVASNMLGVAKSQCKLACEGKESILRGSQHPSSMTKITELEAPKPVPMEVEETPIGAPEFMLDLRDTVDLKEGEFVHLEAQVQPAHDPNLKVEWYINGMPLQMGHRFQMTNDFGFVALNILYVYPEDSGSYTCVAKNKFGEAASQCTVSCRGKAAMFLDPLHPESLRRIQELEAPQPLPAEAAPLVLQKPQFLSALENLKDLKEGQTAHLELLVQPSNDPNLMIEWFHNGKLLSVGHRFRSTHQFGYCSLDVLYIYPEDSGKYTCKATNDLGSAEISCDLSCSSKRSVVTEPAHPESWKKIKQMEEVVPAKPSDIATVHIKPTFVKPLPTETLELKEGHTAHFECQVEPMKDTSLKVEWFFNGAPLKQGHRFRTAYDMGYCALDILYCYPEDSGTYLCRASNAAGEAVCSTTVQCHAKRALYLESTHAESWKLIQEIEAPKAAPEPVPDKQYPKPQFITPLESCEDLQEGETVRLQCSLQPVGDPSLKLVWLRNGQPISESHRFRQSHEFDFVCLDILCIYAEDSAIYSCHAKNNTGESTVSCSIKCAARPKILLDTLQEKSLEKIRIIEAPKELPAEAGPQVYDKPTFIQPLQNSEELKEGESVQLSAQVVPANDPNLRVEWYFNDAPLAMSNRIHFSQDFGMITLFLSNLHANDSGVYICRAVNQNGEAVTTAGVKVESLKSLLLASQHPKGYKKIQELEGLVKFPKTEIADKVFDKPVFMQPLSNVEGLKEGTEAHLECHLTPVGDPTLRIQWLFNGQHLDYGSRYRADVSFGVITLDILYSYPEDSGVYTCKATNSHGEAVTSCVVKVEGYESILRDVQHPVSWQRIQELEAPVIKEEIVTEVQRIKPRFQTALANFEDVPEGQPILLEAQFEPARDDTLKVEWLRNGQTIPAGQLIKTSHELGYAGLEIVTAYPEHSGIYTLKLTNEIGEAASSATVKIAGRGPILTDTTHQASWQKIKELESPKPAAPAAPELQFAPPSFSGHLGNIEVKEGEQVHFECQVDPAKDPTLKIEWFLNGKPVTTGSKYNIRVEFGQICLTIAYAYPEDSGIYMCKATSSSGEAVTSATLKCQGKDSIITSPQQAKSAARIAEMEAGKAPEAPPPEPPKVAPIFKTQLSDLGDLYEGQAAHFEAQIQPLDVKIEWLHNGQPVSASSRVKIIDDFGFVILEINSVEPRDTGEWVCKATNSLGTASSRGNLKCTGKPNIISESQQPKSLEKIVDLERPKPGPEVAPSKTPKPPKFISPLIPLPDLEEGDSVHLEAQLVPVDDPQMRIEWFRDGKQLSFGHRYRPINDFGFCILDIIYVLPQHNGEYVCRATNACGQDSTTTALRCAAKPSLILQPQVSAAKSKAVDDLEDSLKPKKPEAQPEAPKVAPVFVEPIKVPTTLKEGENAHFAARISPANDPELRVEWLFNGTQLQKGSRVKAIADFGFIILELSPVYPEDSGEYVCRAVNSVGEAVAAANITVESQKRIIGESQLPQRMSGAQEKIRIIETPKIPPEAAPDKVYGPPSFKTNLEDLTDLVEGEIAHFECELNPADDPKMKVEWFHNDKPIFHSSRIKMIHDFGFVIMEISPSEPQDTGIYTCRATNRWGTAETKAKIEVKGGSGIITDWQMDDESHRERIKVIEDSLFKTREPFIAPDKDFPPPQFGQELENLGEIMEGESVAFATRLETFGDPTLQIEWLHNGHSIPYSNRIHMGTDFGFITLEINSVIKEDSGDYVCRATSSKGTAETTGRLLVKSKVEVIKPEFISPLMPEITGVQEGDTVHMECLVTPANDPHLTIQWQFNNQPLASGHRFKVTYDFGYVALDILFAHPEDSGLYTCKAINEKGEAVTQCSFSVEGRPGLVFQRQAPRQSREDLERHIRQYTVSEVLLGEEDIYEDGKDLKPVFKCSLNGMVVNEGDFARLECQLAPVHDPNLRVDWFINGKAVMLGHRFRPISDFGFVALDLLYSLPSDSGDYMARATNSYGTAETSAKFICAPRRKVITESQIPQGLSLSSIKDPEQIYWSDQVGRQDMMPKVRFPPVFTIVPRPLQVRENEPARIEIAVNGYPRPRLQWFINGREVVNGARYKLSYDGMHYLIIPQVRISDAGEIVAVAKNSEGETQVSTTLDVFLAQDFRRLVLRSATKGEEETSLEREERWKRETLGSLSEAFEKAPRPDLTKLMRVEAQKQLPSPLETEELSDRFQRKRDEEYEKFLLVEQPKGPFPSLQLQPVQLKPSKVVKSELPKEEPIKVDLRPAPKAEPFQPASEELDYLQIIQKPMQPEEIQKKFNLKPPVQQEVIVPAKDQIQLKKAKPKPAAEPEDLGRVELEKPTAQPQVPHMTPLRQPVDIPAADQVQLKSAFKPKAQVVTTKADLEPVQLKTSSGTQKQLGQEKPDYSLTTKRVSTKSSMGIPPAFGKQLQPIQAEIGRSAKFVVEFSGGQPMTVTWLKDGKEVTSTFEHQINTTATSSSLGFSKIKPDHAGVYVVQLTNTAGTCESSSNLVIAERQDTGKAPNFLESLTPLNVGQGQSAQFKVTVEGDPQPTITWFKDGRGIVADKRVNVAVSGNTHTLTITEAFPQDSGVYECVAKNPVGENRSKANLVVAIKKVVSAGAAGDPPAFSKQIANISTTAGGTAKFSAVVNGVPQPSVVWLQNGKILRQSPTLKIAFAKNNFSLEISKVSATNVGTYTCRATNPSGKAECSAELSLQ